MRQLAVLAAGAVVAIAAAVAEAQTPPATGPEAPRAPAAVAGPEAGEAAPGLPETDPNDPWIWGDVAVLRGLDKVTAETRDFRAPVGEDVPFFALTISVKRCAKRPPERTPEVIVGMEIYDRQTNGEGGEAEPVRVFSGWMFGSSPALNPLEHPVYDVWVLDCVRSEDLAAAPRLNGNDDEDAAVPPRRPAETAQPGDAPD